MTDLENAVFDVLKWLVEEHTAAFNSLSYDKSHKLFRDELISMIMAKGDFDRDAVEKCYDVMLDELLEALAKALKKESAADAEVKGPDK